MIRQLVQNGKYAVGLRASDQLKERSTMEWQVVTGLADGKLLIEVPNAVPNPTIEVAESLPDGTDFKVDWSLLRQSGVARLVTVHFFDRT